MNYFHLITITFGLILLFWGFGAAYGDKKPYDLIGSIAAPIGLIIALLGVLLLFVPHFFTK